MRKITSSAEVHKDAVLENREQKKLYLLLLCKGKRFLQQPQTLLEGGGNLKPESLVVYLMLLDMLVQNTWQ